MMQGADAGQNPTADKQGQPLTEVQWRQKVEKRIQECEKALEECKKMLEEHKAQAAKNAPTPAT